MTNPTPHRATPEQWAEQELWAASDSEASCILELRDRLAALEAQPPRRPGLLTMELEGRVDGLRISLEHALRRIAELEQLQSWVPPTTADILDALDARLTALEANSSAGLTGSNHPVKPDSSAPAIEPPELSEEVADALHEGPGDSEDSASCARRIYRAGWDAAMAAQGRRQQDEDAERAAEPAAPAGSLVDRVCTAIVEHGDGETYTDEARAAIYEVANWLEQFEVVGAVHALRGEVERG